MADKLVETGWAYPCFCTEEELIAKREQVTILSRKFAAQASNKAQRSELGCVCHMVRVALLFVTILFMPRNRLAALHMRKQENSQHTCR